MCSDSEKSRDPLICSVEENLLVMVASKVSVNRFDALLLPVEGSSLLSENLADSLISSVLENETVDFKPSELENG
jgi:hypothetical protein